jgi:hypothetical protein
MPQYARPCDDVTVGSWTTTPLWQKLDETVRDDGDYISSPTNPTTPTNNCEIKLSTVSTPSNRLNHILKYTYRKSASAGRTINVTVKLLQGSTLIKSWTHTNISEVWTQGTQTLTEEEANQITNYGDLRVRYEPSYSGTGSSRSCQWSWCVFEVPKASTGMGLTVIPL